MGSHHDGYYDTIGSSRSPTGQHQQQQQHQSLHRASSRHFETFASQSGLYTAEDHAARFDTNRYDTSRLGTAVTGYGYDSGAQTWNASSFGGAGALAAMGGATGRIKTPSRQRSALPAMWTDTAPISLPTVSPLAGMGNVPLGPSPMRTETVGSDPDEELIPTAIVIKNIPFAVKKEQLVQLMTDLNLPLPYAFNYHFDNGVFRGLAFANFTTAEETATVIDVLNHFDLQGRKLRVEYKKMLPLVERERIEREKRERRGQLEEQHRPVQMQQQQQQQQQQPPNIPLATSPSPSASRSKPDVDLNDPQTLQFYSQLLLFRDDLSREALIFPSTLSPQQRRIVHTLAHHMALAHVSRGTGEQRQVHVFRAPVAGAPSISPPSIPTTVHPVESHQRRVLTRATTMDFSDARSEGAGMYSTIGRHGNSLLDIPSSPSGRGDIHSRNLRAAKSFADLRSYTPSPVPSSASFPAALGGNISRYTDYGASVTSTTPSLTPTATGTTVSASNASESLLVNGLAGVSLTSSLGGNLGVGGASLRDPRDPRGVLILDRERQNGRDNYDVSTPVSAGSNGGMSMRGYGGISPYNDEPTSANSVRGERGQVVPSRQPRGPDPDRNAGFASRRQHNRGSGELDVQSGAEIVVE